MHTKGKEKVEKCEKKRFWKNHVDKTRFGILSLL
jgi:hypothetical protein